LVVVTAYEAQQSAPQIVNIMSILYNKELKRS